MQLQRHPSYSRNTPKNPVWLRVSVRPLDEIAFRIFSVSYLPLDNRLLAGFVADFFGAFFVGKPFLARGISLLDGTLGMDAGGGIGAFAAHGANFTSGIGMKWKGLGIILHDCTAFLARPTWIVQTASRLASRGGKK